MSVRSRTHIDKKRASCIGDSGVLLLDVILFGDKICKHNSYH
jgi:hypothetical protein